MSIDYTKKEAALMAGYGGRARAIASAMGRNLPTVSKETKEEKERARLRKKALDEAADRRFVRWMRANPDRDPATEAPRHIREAVGFKDTHRREERRDGSLRRIARGRHSKSRVLWTNYEYVFGRLREISLHATKGYRSRRA